MESTIEKERTSKKSNQSSFFQKYIPDHKSINRFQPIRNCTKTTKTRWPNLVQKNSTEQKIKNISIKFEPIRLKNIQISTLKNTMPR